MNVFISWSGARSHAVAKILKDWLGLVIQASRPWLSSSDIEGGARWSNQIYDALKDSKVGIFCLTAENKNAPWILFEAGAVAKGVETNRIRTLLIELKPADITGPLGQFNHTSPDKEGMLKMVRELNESAANLRIDGPILDKSFEANWHDFEVRFAQALIDFPADVVPAATPSTSDMLAEILSTVRGLGTRINSLEGALQQTEIATEAALGLTPLGLRLADYARTPIVAKDGMVRLRDIAGFGKPTTTGTT